MTNYYNVEGIKKQIKKQIEEGKTILKAWEEVTYNTKKDNKPFANMQKNITGAFYSTRKYGNENQKILNVYGSYPHYIDDSIDCYLSINPYNKNKHNALFEEKPENIKISGNETFYIYDIDDIKKAVVDRIEYWKKDISVHEKQLKICEKVFTQFQNDFNALKDNLKNDCDFEENRDLYYMIFETVVNYF